MESLSKASAADASREKELCAPSRAMSECPSLPSYKDYPAPRPLANTLVHCTPPTTTSHSCRPSSPSKAFPETSSAVILSALRNLQEKIRSLELEKEHAELSLRSMGKDAPHTHIHTHTHLQSDRDAQRLSHTQPDARRERSERPNSCNQVLITHLADAESRCVKLERQLDHMRRMLRHAKADGLNLKEQVSKSPDRELLDAASERAQSEKLERLEQEYLRLTRTQNKAEVKIHELEMKLQEEEHQMKLVQDKADQLQTGLEANRILLQAVVPRLSRRTSKGKKSSPKSLPQPPSCTEPHYRLSLRDVPFVAGTSAGCSHSVRANVQSVLSLLKQHQPQLCNKRVLSHNPSRREAASDSESSSSSSSFSSFSRESELSELLQALQEELRLMSLEQDVLMREVEASVSQQERKDLQRDQERLLLQMERKGEQIRKLHRHKTQIKKLLKEFSPRRGGRSAARAPAAGTTTRGHSAGAVKLKPGEKSKRNLMLLRDMKALQTSLRT